VAFDTVANVVSEASIELGLGSVSDVFGSTDAHIIQLRTLLKRVGRSLVKDWPWSHLLKEHSFATVGGTAIYALPTDFGEMVDQSGWNRTSQMPLKGPASAQEWHYLKGRTSTSTLSLIFRPWQRLIQFTAGSSTPDAQTVAFEYVSTRWVVPSGQSTPTLDAPTANTDTLWLDDELLITGLCLRFLRSKGFPSDAAQLAHEDAWVKAIGQDAPAPILHLGGARTEPLLGWCNIPDTGYGS
jgi:hypothetical protein